VSDASVWLIIGLGDVFSVSSGEGLSKEKMENGIFPVYGGNGVTGFHNAYLFEDEKLIIGRVGEHCGNVYITFKCSWITDNALIISFYKKNENLLFWYYYLKYLKLNQFAYSSAQPVITGGILKNLKAYIPQEKNEQQKIAKILATIDNLIEKTEALIEKYQAIKQGMMHDLFTRGIDTNGQLRPSYHDAPHLYKQTELGWIPKEWDVLQIGLALEKGMITLIQDGNHGESYPRSSDFAEYGVPFISAKHITKTGAIDFQSCPKLPHNYLSKLRIGFGEPGDVVFAHNATVGPVGIVKENVNFIASTSTTIYRTDSKTILNGFLYYQLKSPLFQEQIQRVMGQTTRNQVPITEQKGQWMVLMSKEEQKQIQITLEKLDAVYEKELSFYKKHSSVKKGLMQDLLTGEVKVKING